MEGSLRQSGSRLRIAVQLVDTNSGVHLWAETRSLLQSEAAFELQDEIVPQIVSTSPTGTCFAAKLSEALRSKGSIN